MSPVTGAVVVFILCYVGVSAVDVPTTVAAKLIKPWFPIEKLGECPADVDFPTCGKTTVKPDCLTDKDCNGTRKCCFSGCKNRCLLPLATKEYACPYFNHADCIFIKPAPSNCVSDNQCQGTDRCCYKCNGQCTPTEKPGCCPAPTTVCLPVHSLPPLCENDGECEGNKKCCTPVCQRECVDI